MANINDVIQAIEKFELKNDKDHAAIFKAVNSHAERITRVETKQENQDDFSERITRVETKQSSQQSLLKWIIGGFVITVAGIITGVFTGLFKRG